MTKKHKSQRGATMVESAISISLFFMLVLGIWNFGRVYHLYQIATNAAREGARFSVAPDPVTGNLPTTAAVQDRVQQFLTLGAVTVNSSNINVSQGASVTINGVALTVTTVHITAPFQFYGLPFGPINVTTEARMRNETN